jgi:hypothetical protein
LQLESHSPCASFATGCDTSTSQSCPCAGVSPWPLAIAAESSSPWPATSGCPLSLLFRFALNLMAWCSYVSLLLVSSSRHRQLPPPCAPSTPVAVSIPPLLQPVGFSCGGEPHCRSSSLVPANHGLKRPVRRRAAVLCSAGPPWPPESMDQPFFSFNCFLWMVRGVVASAWVPSPSPARDRCLTVGRPRPMRVGQEPFVTVCWADSGLVEGRREGLG